MAEDALTFRVLRLAKPTLDISRPLKFVLDEDTAPDHGRLGSHDEASTSETQAGFADRVQMQSAVDACGVSGRLMLSKSFGEAYLGEVHMFHCSEHQSLTSNRIPHVHAAAQSFVGYVSLVNKSTARATDVIVKVSVPFQPCKACFGCCTGITSISVPPALH